MQENEMPGRTERHTERALPDRKVLRGKDAQAWLVGKGRRKRNKYSARKVEVDGVTFDSRLEARRWATLKLLERAGDISDLQRQINFPIMINGQLICTYRADFAYKDEKGELVVEDAKGVETEVFKIKKKAVKAMYGIDILVTKSK